MESAIPQNLEMQRTRHKRVPDDYQPPYPSFVARYKPAVSRVVMAYFGVQYRGAAPAVATEQPGKKRASGKTVDFPDR